MKSYPKSEQKFESSPYKVYRNMYVRGIELK